MPEDLNPEAAQPTPAREPGETEVPSAFRFLASLEQEARRRVQEQPVVAVLTAVGIGFLLARLAVRVSR